MPTFDNNWLKSRSGAWSGARNGPDYAVDILKKATQAPQVAPSSDPLEEAKAFLAKPSVANQSLSPEEEAALNARLDWNKQNQVEAQRIQTEKQGSLRHVTEGLDTAGDVAGVGSLTTLPLPPVSAALMGLSGLLKVPNQLRRAYAPQNDETQPGVGEALMTGAALLPGMSGLRSLLPKAAEPLVSMSREVPYAAESGAVAPLEYDLTGAGPRSTVYPKPETLQALRDAILARKTAKPDLMDEYLSSVSGGPKPFSMDGIDYAPDASGSHKAVVPDVAQSLRKPTGPGSSHGPTSEYYNGVRYDTTLRGDAQSAAKYSKGKAMRAWAEKKKAATQPVVNPVAQMNREVLSGARNVPPARPELAESMPTGESAWDALLQLNNRHDTGGAISNTPRQSIEDMLFRGPEKELNALLPSDRTARARALADAFRLNKPRTEGF